MTNEYHKQAEDFLKKWGVEFKPRYAQPQQKPLWVKGGEPYGYCWSIELTRHDSHKQDINFYFWDSVANKKRDERTLSGKPQPPHAYDVLASLDVGSGAMTFEEFCDNYGYDNDSITAQETYKLSQELDAKLRTVFSEQALSELSEIQ